MSLMLTLDDAMDVLIHGDFIKDGYIDNDGEAEYVRSELEQKCYSIMKPATKTWFDQTKQTIEYLTSSEEIARHIAKNDLEDWLRICRDNVMAELTLLADEKKP